MPHSNKADSATTPRKTTKPAKPYPDFPLFPHATGRWAKKIRGKLHYFGPWHDWQAALDRYNQQAADLPSGRTVRIQGDGLTVAELCNHFLATKESLRNSGDLSVHTFNDHLRTAKRVVAAFGRTRLVGDIGSADFANFRESLAKTLGPVALGIQITRTRVIFNYGHQEGLIHDPSNLARLQQSLFRCKEPIHNVADGGAFATGSRSTVGMEVVALIEIKLKRVVGITPGSEVVKLATYLLGPTACGMRKEWKVRPARPPSQPNAA